MNRLFSEAIAIARPVDHPRICRQDFDSGTLESILHGHYGLVYEIDGDTVWILALVHTPRQWPPLRDQVLA